MLLCHLCQNVKKREQVEDAAAVEEESGFSQKRPCSSGLKQGDPCPWIVQLSLRTLRPRSL